MKNGLGVNQVRKSLTHQQSKIISSFLGWNAIVLNDNIPLLIEDRANPKNPEFVKFLQKTKKNSSTVYSTFEGIK